MLPARYFLNSLCKPKNQVFITHSHVPILRLFWGPNLSCTIVLLIVALEKKGKGSAGSDDTASMIKGGGYLGARTRQTIKKKSMWVRGIVCRSTVAPRPKP